MASIFLNKKRSRFWIACFTVNSKQVQRSTRVTEKGQALAIATAYELTGRQAQAGVLTDEHVRENVNYILRLTGGNPLQVPSIRSWFNSWTKNAKASRSEGTSLRYDGVEIELLEFLGSKAERSIQALSQNDLANFRDYLITEGKAPASVNLALKAILDAAGLKMVEQIAHTEPALLSLFVGGYAPSFGNLPRALMTGP